MLVSNIHEKAEKLYKKNKFKKAGPIWGEEFELPSGSNSVTDISTHFECRIKNMRKLIIYQYKSTAAKLKMD